MEFTDCDRGRIVVDEFSEKGAIGDAGIDGCSFLAADLAAGGTTFPPETPADILGALLGALLGAWLGGLVDGVLQISLSEGDGDSRIESGPESKVEVDRSLSRGLSESTSFSRASRVCPGSLGYAPDSGDGSGMLASFGILSLFATNPALIVSSE